MVKFSADPPKQSLLRLESGELSDLAVECFNSIMCYMGDLPMPPEVTEVKCVYTILMVSRDPLFFCNLISPNLQLYINIVTKTIEKTYLSLFLISALPQTRKSTRRSLLSNHEANHQQQVSPARLLPTGLETFQHNRRLLHLFTNTETIPL